MDKESNSLDRVVDNKKELKLKQILKFIIPSAIGILFFLTPFKNGENYSILIAIVAGKFTDLFFTQMPYFIYAVIFVSGGGVIITKLFKPKFVIENYTLNNLFNISPTWSLVRILGVVIAVMCLFEIGPEMFISEDTGMFIMNGLLVYWIGITLVAGFCLTFLMDYGLLEFTGIYMSKIFRPLFTLPGRASVDCIASWVGDAIVGIILTTDQYKKGFYSEREAATIATTFSAVSIAFTVIVVNQVGLNHMFFQFFLTTITIGTICGIIMPRIPPLSLKKNNFCVQNPDREFFQPEGIKLFNWALEIAVDKASRTEMSLKKWLINSIKISLETATICMPVVMFIGTTSLVLSSYTPIFDWLGLPFLPLLRILNIPEAAEASSCLVVGLGDMFIPAIIAGAKIQSEMTRFIIGVISITQLIYMSEVGALLLSSRLPLKLKDLLLIFLERTIISLIAATVIARFVLQLV